MKPLTQQAWPAHALREEAEPGLEESPSPVVGCAVIPLNAVFPLP